jgi:hypothetical protein
MPVQIQELEPGDVLLFESKTSSLFAELIQILDGDWRSNGPDFDHVALVTKPAVGTQPGEFGVQIAHVMLDGFEEIPLSWGLARYTDLTSITSILVRRHRLHAGGASPYDKAVANARQMSGNGFRYERLLFLLALTLGRTAGLVSRCMAVGITAAQIQGAIAYVLTRFNAHRWRRNDPNLAICVDVIERAFRFQKPPTRGGAPLADAHYGIVLPRRPPVPVTHPTSLATSLLPWLTGTETFEQYAERILGAVGDAEGLSAGDRDRILTIAADFANIADADFRALMTAALARLAELATTGVPVPPAAQPPPLTPPKFALIHELFTNLLLAMPWQIKHTMTLVHANGEMADSLLVIPEGFFVNTCTYLNDARGVWNRPQDQRGDIILTDDRIAGPLPAP